MSEPPIKALVVDDSAFARKVLRQVLGEDPRIEVVGFARDGLEALEKIAELAPDVVTLDLVMPELDGVGVLDALRNLESRPEIVLVTMTDAESPLGIAALEAGAFDVVHKPTALATERLYELGAELVVKVVAAGERRRRLERRRQHHRRSGGETSDPPAPSSRRSSAEPLLARTRTDLVVVGASTGGPRAVGELLKGLPASFPVPLCVVLHMPAGYTDAFANRLDSVTHFEVLEAREGMVLRPGRVVIARAGSHLEVRRSSRGELSAHLDVTPLEALHRPAVDVLFQSAAETLGARVLGVVLTGMGVDGLEGARALRRAGSRLVVEDAASCVVYGMPRAVWEADLADAKVPLEGMASTILDLL